MSGVGDLAGEKYIRNRKYGLTRRLLSAFNRLVRVVTRKQPEPSVYIEIVDT